MCFKMIRMNAVLTLIPFKKLDFGETEIFDKVYNADVAVVDMSFQDQQLSLFYHVGMRDSMGKPKTIILINDTDPELTLSVKVLGSKQFFF